ncbi:MAG: type III pantothenate kinase [Phycisphaerales bacterium]
MDRLIAIAVGNTRTRLALFEGGELSRGQTVVNEDPAELATRARDLLQGAQGATPVIASVNDPVADRLEEALDAAGASPVRIGRDLAIPLRHTLDDASTLGQDRALNALGAYSVAEQACVIVDVGTAVSVDFVDGQGVFHGGVIAPGLNMMLRALHEQTAALPSLRYEACDPARGPFGLDTAHAMRLGVCYAVRGLVRFAAERFADFYEGYPQIIATGGDMGVLEDDGLIEHFVPDLQLVGIHACVAQGARADDDA